MEVAPIFHLHFRSCSPPPECINRNKGGFGLKEGIFFIHSSLIGLLRICWRLDDIPCYE